jgi:glycosyltransferase involved in cell wall biosynthesis
MRYHKTGADFQFARDLIFSIPAWEEERRFVRDSKFDIVVIHSYMSVPSPILVAALLSRVLGSNVASKLTAHAYTRNQSQAPSVMLFHGLNSMQGRFQVLRRYYRVMEDVQFTLSDASIVVDSYMDERFGHRAKPTLLLLGSTDLSLFRPIDRSIALGVLKSQLGIDLELVQEKDKVALYYGRASLQKGFELVENVAMRHRQFWLIIAGPTGLGSVVEEKKKLAVIDSAIPNPVIPYLISLADLVLNPVSINGISLTTMESMACGKPVAMLRGYNRRPLREGIDYFALKTFDSKSVISELEEIFEEPKILTALTVSARPRALELFETRRHASALDNFLVKVASEPHKIS